jgi:hypothetical protein
VRQKGRGGSMVEKRYFRKNIEGGKKGKKRIIEYLRV